MAEVPFPVPGVKEQEMVVEEADEDDDDKNKEVKFTNTAISSRKRPKTRSQTVKLVPEAANIKKATDNETLRKFNK